MTSKDDVLVFIREHQTATVADVRRRFPELSDEAATKHVDRLYRARLIDPATPAPIGRARFAVTGRGLRRLAWLRSQAPAPGQDEIRFV